MRRLFVTLLVTLALVSGGLAVDKTTCSACEGTGKCQVCGGDGVVYDGSGCTICTGTGHCFYCDGQGKH